TYRLPVAGPVRVGHGWRNCLKKGTGSLQSRFLSPWGNRFATGVCEGGGGRRSGRGWKGRHCAVRSTWEEAGRPRRELRAPGSRNPRAGFPGGGVTPMSSVPPREYEFSPDQNALLGALSARMRVVGLFLAVVGVLNILAALIIVLAIYRAKLPQSYVDS